MHLLKHLFFIILLAGFGCSELLVNEPEISRNLADFDAAYSITKKVYPFFEFKNINWDSLYVQYGNDAAEARGDEIYSVLYELLRELKDGHVEILTEGGYHLPTYYPSRKNDRKSFDPLVIRKYFDKELKLSGNDIMAYGILKNQVGYVHITSFNWGPWFHDFDHVMKGLINTRGLIIDIRNNPGGSTNATDFIISRLIDNQIQYSFHFPENIEQKYVITPNKELNYLKPVCVLINGASFSAAELFPELLRQLPNVTLIGDTTGGGGGSADIYNLPSGKKIRISRSYFTRLDGKMVEWNGIVPDIVIEQTESDINNNKDKQLESAINFLN